MIENRKLLAIGLLAGAVACSTEQEILENGAEMDAPDAVQEAPLAPIPEPVGPSLPNDSLGPAPMDTTGLEDV
jgi:hypothetical protein